MTFGGTAAPAAEPGHRAAGDRRATRVDLAGRTRDVLRPRDRRPEGGLAPADLTDGTTSPTGHGRSFADTGSRTARPTTTRVCAERAGVFSTRRPARCDPDACRRPVPSTGLVRRRATHSRVDLSWTNPSRFATTLSSVVRKQAAPAAPSRRHAGLQRHASSLRNRHRACERRCLRLRACGSQRAGQALDSQPALRGVPTARI